MLKRKLTIWLLGIMCLSPVSAYLTVICHGSDGHTAVESVAHDHCECPETASQDQKTFIAACPDHCEDTIAISNIVAPAKKNLKLSTHKTAATAFFLRSDVASGSICNSADRSDQSTPFHTPLRTIILLA
jgi:hypothetical protein